MKLNVWGSLNTWLSGIGGGGNTEAGGSLLDIGRHGIAVTIKFKGKSWKQTVVHQKRNIFINATPELSKTPSSIFLKPGESAITIRFRGQTWDQTVTHREHSIRIKVLNVRTKVVTVIEQIASVLSVGVKFVASKVRNLL